MHVKSLAFSAHRGNVRHRRAAVLREPLRLKGVERNFECILPAMRSAKSFHEPRHAFTLIGAMPTSLVRIIAVCLLALTCSLTHSQAGLGESEIQCAGRYGAAKTDQGTKLVEKSSPLIEGGITRTYDYQGWHIRIGFFQLGGPAVRIVYHKVYALNVAPAVNEQEIAAILKANTPDGMVWAKAAYDKPGSPKSSLTKPVAGMFTQGLWKRTDGATAQSPTGGTTMTLELPAVRQYEAQLKQQKEQKARASVPQF